MDPATISAMLGIAAGLKGLFSGSKSSSPKKLGNMLPQQQQLFDQLLEGLQGGGPLAGMFGPFDAGQATDVFNQTVRQPAMQNFQETVVPTIAGQFRKGNLGNSASFENALSRAGRDVELGLDGQLAAMLQNGQQQSNAQRLQAMMGLTGRSAFDYQKPQPGFLDSFLNGAAPAAGRSIMDLFMGSNGPFKDLFSNNKQKTVSTIFSDDLGPVAMNYNKSQGIV